MSPSFLLSPSAADSDPAVFDPHAGEWTTYGELREQISRVSEQLGAPNPKSLVALFTTGTLADIVWYLAAISAGHVVMLCDSLMSPARTQDMVATYLPDWLVCETDLGIATSGYEPIDSATRPTTRLRRQSSSSVVIHPTQALLLSTSGSTGSRKHVCLSKHNLESNADSIASALRIGPEDRAILTLPLHYSYGLSVVNSHLRAGGSVVLNPFSVIQTQFWKLVHETRARSLAGVPVTYQLLRRLGASTLAESSIRVMTQAGGPLARELVLEFHRAMDALGGAFFVMYGQTEATARIAILCHEDAPRKPGSVGRAVPGGRLSVDGSGGNASSGEIVYSGENVMLGYAEHRQDLFMGNQLNGVLHTGDVGTLDDDGFLYVTGRSKRIAKVDGKRVSLDEIERLVGVEGERAVVGGDDAIHVFCVGDTREHLEELSKGLSVATGLRRGVFRFRQIGALPLTSSGKTDYQNLAGLL